MIKRKVFYKEYSPEGLEADFDGHVASVRSAVMEELNAWNNETEARIINVIEKSFIGNYVEDLPFFYRLSVFAEVYE